MKVETIQLSILEKARTNCRCTKLDALWAHDTSGGLELPGPVVSSECWKVGAAAGAAFSCVFPLGTAREISAFLSVTGRWVLIVQRTGPTISDRS